MCCTTAIFFITPFQIPGANSAQTSYSPTEFLHLLNSKAPIPENCHVKGSLELWDVNCTPEALARLPKGLHVEGCLGTWEETGHTDNSVGFLKFKSRNTERAGKLLRLS